MILAATDCTLLLVDFQQRLMPAIPTATRS